LPKVRSIKRELVGAGVAHADLAAGDRAQRQEGGDLVEVLGEVVFGPAEMLDPLDHQPACPDAVDLRPHLGQEGAELLYVRLGGGVGQGRGPGGGGGAEHEVLGGGDRGVVEPVAGGGERAAIALDVVQRQRASLGRNLDAEGLEHLDVRVDLAHAEGAALHVALDPRLAEPGQQRRDQHDRRAHALRQPRRLGIQLAAMADGESSGLEVDLDLAAEPLEQLDDLARVGDVETPRRSPAGR
jgi:hypothetical protein